MSDRSSYLVSSTLWPALFVLLLPLLGCRLYDRELVDGSEDSRSSMAGRRGSSPNAALSDTPVGPPECRPNPNPEDRSCPEICPEVCNERDDDCDGEADEAAADESCNASHSNGVCLAGKCYIDDCRDGARDCDLDPSNGCEVEADDVAHCGGCGQACSVERGEAACHDGRCQVAMCGAGFADCDGLPDACETETTTLLDCGGCGMVCALDHAASSCSTGECDIKRCGAAFADCDDQRENGCESSLTTLSDCGDCNTRCSKTSCAGGVCSNLNCESGSADCDGDEVSCEVDLRADLKNCGLCGFRCEWDEGVTPHASLSCSPDGCKANCEPGWGDCDGDYRTGCEQALNSLAHCGQCGARCSIANAMEVCNAGNCENAGCDPDFADCDNDASSCETAIDTEQNCGGCGRVCDLPHATAQCRERACAVARCQLNWQDCDGDPANGCERDVRAPADGGQGPCSLEDDCERSSEAGHDYYVCTTPRSWTDARERCKRLQDGDLVQIADGAELDRVRALLKASSWVGLNDRTIEGLWAWSSNNVPTWQGGADGSTVDGAFANWSSGQPGTDDDCASVSVSGGFESGDCNAALTFVCEVSPDACPNDGGKRDPGQCGCGMPDSDDDRDGFAACKDGCPNDKDKLMPGTCGCGVSEVDSDGDDAADCVDECDDDPMKSQPGDCGCGTPDVDTDGDGTADCKDNCPNDATTATDCFSYVPNNFDPAALDFDGVQNATINCGNAVIDTTSSQPIFSNWCGTPPAVATLDQNGGPGLVIIPLRGLTIAPNNSIRFVGPRPVILAVLGDVTISGTLDVSGNGAQAGAGANFSCGASSGGDGAGNNVVGGSGGGGGGFGSRAGRGGATNNADGGNGGAPRGNPLLVPLIGGCNGGRGGGCGGNRAGGAGAMQLSASGTITINGNIRANGADGAPGCPNAGGGGGGGSGGAILIEAKVVNNSGTISASGGNGGRAAANGGTGSSNANNTGSNGNNGSSAGGGGGGFGRIRILRR